MERFEQTTIKEVQTTSISQQFSPSDFAAINRMNGNDSQPGRDKEPSHLTFDDPYPKSNYQIAAGDSLWGIATRNLQKGSSAPSAAEIAGEVSALAKENNISNPDMIFAGQTIRMPGRQSSDAPQEGSKPGGNGAPGHDAAPGGNGSPGKDAAAPPGGNPTNPVDTGNMDGNNQAIMNYFVGKGLTPEQAAGIAGNFAHESYSNPDQHQLGGGPGYGLAQWEDGGRLQELQNFAAQNGKPISDLGLQLDFVWHELNTTESASLASLRSAGSAADAAYVFERDYERAGVPAIAERQNYAQQALNQYRPA